MDIEDLEKAKEKIKQRQERFGETEASKHNLEQIDKAIEFREQNKGNPDYELSELLEPIPSRFTFTLNY